jgi:hypothetical protein
MCEFCKNEKSLLSIDVISDCSWGWRGDTSIKFDEVVKNNMHLFVDRGFLRLVDIGDCCCIESGEKVAISFCPFCGEKIES